MSKIMMELKMQDKRKAFIPDTTIKAPAAIGA
jgi:hypothetical protein